MPSMYDDPGDSLGPGGTDFALQLGQGYAVYTDIASRLTIAGTPAQATTRHLVAGWNLIGFPDAASGTYNPFQLLTTLLNQALGNYAEIDAYSKGQFSPSAFDDPGDGLGVNGQNFPITAGKGYALYTDFAGSLVL